MLPYSLFTFHYISANKPFSTPFFNLIIFNYFDGINLQNSIQNGNNIHFLQLAIPTNGAKEGFISHHYIYPFHIKYKEEKESKKKNKKNAKNNTPKTFIQMRVTVTAKKTILLLNYHRHLGSMRI